MDREEVLQALEHISSAITAMELRSGLIQFEGDYYGYGLSPTFSFRFKNLLKDIADVSITENYLSDPSISIQYLALDVLASQKSESLYNLLYQILTEHGEEEGVWYPGCVGRTINVKSKFFSHFEKYLTGDQKSALETTFGPFATW